MKRVVSMLYRVRGLLILPSAVILLLNVLVLRLSLSPAVMRAWVVLVLVAMVTFIGCLVLTLAGKYVDPAEAPRAVEPPVRGRWLAINSPATKVPSHGIRMYGQTYAIDLVDDPLDGSRPEFGGAVMRGNEAYPAFGQPVYAMVDGVVVAASDWRRDHRARSNLLGVLYMFVEGAIRELGGPGFIIGNRVTIRTDDGVFATVAHLQRGSVTVRVGDRVSAGDRIGCCGNSGNSSEPHVHAQLADRKSFFTAQGLPFELPGGVPATGEHLVTPQ